MFNFKEEVIVRPNGLTAKIKTASFTGKLKSVSDNSVGVTSGGKEFYVGVVEFPDANGEVVERSCIIYNANFEKGMELGKEYLCRVSINSELPKGDRNRVVITMSHLTAAANLASDSDFGIETKIIEREIEVVEEV